MEQLDLLNWLVEVLSSRIWKVLNRRKRRRYTIKRGRIAVLLSKPVRFLPPNRP